MIFYRSTKQKIVKNEVLCKLCNYVVSSKDETEVFCHCGKVGVSGGSFYLRRSFPDLLSHNEAFVEMSEFESEGVCHKQKKSSK